MSNSEPMQKKSNLNGVSTHNDNHTCTPLYSVPSLKTANKWIVEWIYGEWIFMGKEGARFEVVHELPYISREESGSVIKNGG